MKIDATLSNQYFLPLEKSLYEVAQLISRHKLEIVRQANWFNKPKLEFFFKSKVKPKTFSK